MDFKRLESVLDASVDMLNARLPLTELPAGAYAAMRYPKFPAVMRFSVRRYAAAGFGNVFIMYTRALGGMMQLATLVCTPNCGTDVPLLLIDAMAVGKKRAAFVEYYDLTESGAQCPLLAEVAAQYANLPDYPEKPAWYVSCRTPYSLIKGGTDDARLAAMLADSVWAYAETCALCKEARPENRARLAAFAERMATQGNPSSATMERVLGKSGADAFFRTLVMPTEFTRA